MRRRIRDERILTAEELVVVGNGLTAEGVSAEVLRHGLAQHGYTALDYIRARFWLRHGKPSSYRWDETLQPSLQPALTPAVRCEVHGADVLTSCPHSGSLA